MNTPPKIMIAKPGLDGHDRGAVVIVQALRDAGFDVIYTGIRRTPEQIAVAAGQEDVDGLGISCLSGAHVPLCGALKQRFDRMGWRPRLLFIGGVIPQEDFSILKDMGYGAIMGPGTPLSEITSTLREKLPARTAGEGKYPDAWLNTATSLTRLELSENGGAKPEGKKGKIIMIAGQGGAGKSTLIGGLVRAAQGRRKTLAVLANDPVSPGRKGSVLADRLRMPADFDPESILIRSLPVRESGAVAGSCRDCALALAKEQYDHVVVETLGVGQNQAPFEEWVDVSAAVVSPDQGDEWQLRKNGLLETCDAVIMTKGDLPQAERFHAELSSVIRDMRPENPPLILRTSLNDMSEAARMLDI